MDFTMDGEKRGVLYLVAATPRPSCPSRIADAALRDAEAYSACPIVALPCLAPLAFLEIEPPRDLMRAAASALRGGLSVTGISERRGIAFADLGPRQRWLEACSAFGSLSLESPFSSQPGICLGPADPSAMQRISLAPLYMSLSVDLFRLKSRDGCWDEGMEWEILASFRAGKAAASQPSGRVI